ncbi:ABC transporter ATP-binding protein [Carnobacteriaceae bacterium zg-ZUI78]|nr:ABC transporter ATP-binding protein [Carnobacteriaceae bacterium zg-ZUI78]
MVENTLVVDNVHFSYKKMDILKGCSLSLTSGQIIGIVAPNGSGKSTLLNIISGNLIASSGEVKFNEKTYKRHFEYMKKSIVKMVDQDDLVDYMTGLEHLKFYAKLFKRSKQDILKVIEELDIKHYIHKKVNMYSYGMKQRLSFAMAILSDASVLLLDEVMNGLDPTNVESTTFILKKLAKTGKIIIIVSHLLDNLDILADRVYFLANMNMSYSIKNDEREKEVIDIIFRNNESIKYLLEKLTVPYSLNKNKLSLVITSDEQIYSIIDKLNMIIHDINEIFVGKKRIHQIYHDIYGL